MFIFVFVVGAGWPHPIKMMKAAKEKVIFRIIND